MTSLREALATLPGVDPDASEVTRPGGDPLGVDGGSRPRPGRRPRLRLVGGTVVHLRGQPPVARRASRPGRRPTAPRPGGPWGRPSASTTTPLLRTRPRHVRGGPAAGHPVIAGMHEVLDRVASPHPVGLITNGPSDIQRLKLEQSGLTGAFGREVISGELGIGKPEPSVFLGLLDGLGADPSASVMVGDSWERDVLGGLGAGHVGRLDRRRTPGAGAPPAGGRRRLGPRAEAAPGQLAWPDCPGPAGCRLSPPSGAACRGGSPRAGSTGPPSACRCAGGPRTRPCDRRRWP